MGVLHHPLQSSVIGITPEGMRKANCPLVKHSILIRSGTRVTEADFLSIGRINCDVPLEISTAIVTVEQSLRRDLVLEAVHGRAGVDERRAAIAPNNQVRSLTENPPAATIAVKSAD